MYLKPCLTKNKKAASSHTGRMHTNMVMCIGYRRLIVPVVVHNVAVSDGVV